MDQEIDLRPYIQALVRSWRLIVGATVGLVLFAVAATMLAPSSSQARGDILVIPQSSQLSLDPRFVERDATMLTNSLNQRQALIDLAKSSILEARVAEAKGLTAYHSGEFLGSIDVRATSDLIQIEASASTPAEALHLAETWTRNYESLVNELYSGTNAQLEQLDQQLSEAQQRFDAIQASLDSFYASGDLVRAEQQVQRLEGLLEGGVEAQVSLYTQYLTRTQELSLILEDARALQAQYEAGGADLSSGLASLAVRARVAGAEQLPVQLSFDSAESFAESQFTSSDLERFVTTLAGERDRMVAQADAIAGDLAAGNAAAVGLPSEVRARYEDELATARGALARAEGTEELILQQRVVALSSLQVLQAKRDEGQIAQGVPEVSVRFVGVASVPPRSLASRLIVNVAVAVILGMVLSIGWIIGRQLIRQLTAPNAGPEKVAAPNERPAERPVATD
jgi:capsular polysaccharide biosynthesis protein